jgi:hypothetical protein
MRPSFRPYLVVAGTLVPLLFFGLLAARQLLRHERDAIEREAIGRARAAMSAVDIHLRSSIVSLEAVGASKSLEAGDIRAFHSESQRALRTQPGWVNIALTTPNRLQLANAVYAFGKPEQLGGADEESFDAAVRSAKAAVGSVAAGTVVRSPTVRLRVPVTYGEELRYVLTAPLNLKPLADVMHAQQLPEDWGIALVDREARVIARIPAAPAGVEESDSFRREIKQAPEGWFEGPSREGRPMYTAYVTSKLSGWILAVAIPAATVDAGERRIMTMLAAGMVLAFVLGLALAWQLSERAAH